LLASAWHLYSKVTRLTNMYVAYLQDGIAVCLEQICVENYDA